MGAVRKIDGTHLAKVAIETGNRVLNKLATLEMNFKSSTGFDIFEFEFIKNEWKYIDKAFARGVKNIGIKFEKDYICCLTHFEPGGVLYSHHHPHWKRIVMVSGTAWDAETGLVYKKGDIVDIEPYKNHYFHAYNGQECYMIIEFSKHRLPIDSYRNVDWETYKEKENE